MVSNTRARDNEQKENARNRKRGRRSGENGEKSETEGKRGVLQRGSHRPAVRCMAEAHHSANYDQAFPCRHSSAGNGKSLFSHTPMEAMGHGAMQMRCVYTRTLIYRHTHTHTNTSKCAASLTLHAHTALTPTRTFLYTEHTHNHHSHHTRLLMHVASRLYIPLTQTHTSSSHPHS